MKKIIYLLICVGIFWESACDDVSRLFGYGESRLPDRYVVFV